VNFPEEAEEMTQRDILHSLDVALERSVTATAFAIGKDGRAFLKVHMFLYRNDAHFVVYRLLPADEDSDDTICGRYGLLKWMVEHTEVKTIRGAQGFLLRRIWEPDAGDPMLRASIKVAST
jgi:hypothetical protein